MLDYVLLGYLLLNHNAELVIVVLSKVELLVDILVFSILCRLYYMIYN